MSQTVLTIYAALSIIRWVVEVCLSRLNYLFYNNRKHQEEAERILGIGREDMEKTLAYSRDKYVFSIITGAIALVALLAFIIAGGLGWIENLAIELSANLPAIEIIRGLLFFAILGLGSSLLSIPFDFYYTFHIEAKHGFNRQTVNGFFIDRVKMLILGALLGGIFLTVLFFIMDKAGPQWWLWAWAATAVFSLLTVWIYPTLLAPLFNKFTPLPEGELKEKIVSLANTAGFIARGIFVMDASKRSSHGNAYFTGIFGAKRIVLFDSLVNNLTPLQIVAVLAHELGHFKLHHVKFQLVRSILMTGLIFFILGRLLPVQEFYEAFGLQGVSNYGALMVFGLWFGLIDFLFQPFESALSRRHEFAADTFAKNILSKTNGDVKDLAQALLRLREKSSALPIVHPLFSKIYYSHPPMLERLKAMGYI